MLAQQAARQDTANNPATRLERTATTNAGGTETFSPIILSSARTDHVDGLALIDQPFEQHSRYFGWKHLSYLSLSNSLYRSFLKCCVSARNIPGDHRNSQPSCLFAFKCAVTSSQTPGFPCRNADDCICSSITSHRCCSCGFPAG